MLLHSSITAPTISGGSSQFDIMQVLVKVPQFHKTLVLFLLQLSLFESFKKLQLQKVGPVHPLWENMHLDWRWLLVHHPW